jgi:hypothetical protein
MIARKVLRMAIVLAMLSGCKTQPGGPLVFVVAHTVGIDIQATSTSTATPGLTVGYKSLNVAVVPTQMATDGGGPLKGCYAVDQNGTNVPPLCGSEEAAKKVVEAAKPKSAALFQDRKTQEAHADNWLDDGRTSASDSYVTEQAFLRKVVAPQALPAPPPPPAVAAAAPRATDKDTGKFSESLVDAYSVYASFNTDAKAGGSGPGVGIGEVFATGDAAVQLAEAVNYYSSRAGNAEIIKAQGASTCVAQLIAAKQAGVEMSKVPDCPAPVTQSNPVPTLASIAPTSGSAPAAGATAGTVIPITLTGTGFNSASSVTVLGPAAVTLDKPKPAADGKTITINLTIAPGAATGAREIFVSNPPPGGGTTITQPFTVN